jgi:hypothetical protein
MPPLPRFTETDVASPAALARQLNQNLDELERRFARFEGPLVNPRAPAAGEEAYLADNFEERRTFNVATTGGYGGAVAPLANVMAHFSTRRSAAGLRNRLRPRRL